MRVRDDHRVDVVRAQVGTREPGLQDLPGARAGQAGVDDRGAAIVWDRIAVDVAETGKPDRQLHPEHAARQLGDLGPGRLLLLTSRHRYDDSQKPAEGARRPEMTLTPARCSPTSAHRS
jgi:hypothetical protein